MAFIKVRKEGDNWRWACSKCPPMRNGRARGGLHKQWRFSRPHERDAYDRCQAAAQKHWYLSHQVTRTLSDW